MGLFGLGGPEIAVIGAVMLFVLGPDKLKELARDAGKAFPEIKEVSTEALAPVDAPTSGGVLDADCCTTVGRLWRYRGRPPFPLRQHGFNEQS